MATVSRRIHESTVGAARGARSALATRVERSSLLAVLTAYSVVYVVVFAGAAITALYLGKLIHGIAGGVVFLTVGLALIAAVPTATRKLLVRILEARESVREHDAGGVYDTSSSRVVHTTGRGNGYWLPNGPRPVRSGRHTNGRDHEADGRRCRRHVGRQSDRCGPTRQF